MTAKTLFARYLALVLLLLSLLLGALAPWDLGGGIERVPTAPGSSTTQLIS